MNDTQHNDTAKDELLPCPSCGGPATKGIGSHATVDHPILWVVECNKRCLSTIYRMDAVEVWNKRHEAAHRWTRVDDSLPERDFETRVNQWYPVTVEYFDPDNPTAPELEVLILDYWFDDRGWRNVPEGGRVTAWREPDLPYHP